MIVICDIDGVLADASHRQHHVAGRPKDWASFFAEVGADPVIAAGRDRLLALAGEHEVVLLSGRPESTRADTQAWLAANGMGGHRLVLRPEADYRRAAELKADLVESIAAPAEVAVVIDDDPTVVERLAAFGYHADLFE